jgi:type III secretion protein V
MIDLKALQQAGGGAFALPGAGGRAGLLSRFGDIGLAVMALVVIALIVLPMPPWVLDILIAANIALGVLVLLFALYVPTPTAFSTFPSVLLFTTLFRVALNVATTRQILLHGHAGDIVDTFGNYVVAGSLLVGLVIFAIITIVQFIVVSKGSERVAEVGARFVLDAMPGKQLAIDADLRAGLITQAEATRQRDKLGLESQFFGSMDGAMKFVKGDAIAGIVIVFVNLLGGMAMGMLVMGLSAGDAVRKFAVLAIGDGLVTQIPAFFIALAAGIVVTRTNSEGTQHLAEQIGRQFSLQPRALLIAGCTIALFALVPGFPVLPFLLIGAALAVIGFRQGKDLVQQVAEGASRQVANAAREGDPLPVAVEDAASAPFAPIAIEFAPEHFERLSLAELGDEIGVLRERLRATIGLPFPGVSIRRGRAGAAGLPRVLLMETPAAHFEAVADGRAFARAAVQEVWRVMLRHAPEFVGVQETRALLTQVERRYPDLVREALGLIGLPPMANLLAALVADGVPLRDLRSVLEAVVDHGGPNTPLPLLVERVRAACSRGLCALLKGDDGALTVMPLAPELEHMLRAQALPPGADGLAQFPFEAVERVAKRLKAVLPTLPEGQRPVLLTASDLRAGLQRQLRAFMPELPVLAHTEVDPSVPIRALGHLALAEDGAAAGAAAAVAAAAAGPTTPGPSATSPAPRSPVLQPVA